MARTEFANGNTNWGRIASLLAFCAVLSQALKENQQESCVELVAQEVSTYLLSHQRTWLVQHDGWVSNMPKVPQLISEVHTLINSSSYSIFLLIRMDL